jgi:hypothetical protein
MQSGIHFTTVKNWASRIWPAKPGVPPEEIGGGTNSFAPRGTVIARQRAKVQTTM